MAGSFPLDFSPTAQGTTCWFKSSGYPRYFWVGWVALGWGLGVLAHGLKAFDAIPFMSGAWERKAVERYLGRKL